MISCVAFQYCTAQSKAKPFVIYSEHNHIINDALRQSRDYYSCSRNRLKRHTNALSLWSARDGPSQAQPRHNTYSDQIKTWVRCVCLRPSDVAPTLAVPSMPNLNVERTFENYNVMFQCDKSTIELIRLAR